MFTHLSNTHTVCLPPERGSPGLGCLHQHISNMLRTAFSGLLQPTDAVLRQEGKTWRWGGGGGGGLEKAVGSGRQHKAMFDAYFTVFAHLRVNAFAFYFPPH